MKHPQHTKALESVNSKILSEAIQNPLYTITAKQGRSSQDNIFSRRKIIEECIAMNRKLPPSIEASGYLAKS